MSLGIPLYACETLLKYIGGLHSCLQHTILMFNLTNLDEVSVQYILLEANKLKHSFEDVSEEPHKFKKQSKGEGKSKNTTIVKKE